MFATWLARQLKYPNTVRQFHCTKTVRDGKTTVNVQSPNPTESLKGSSTVLGANTVTISNFDKRILLWVKRYPNAESIPERVTMDCMAQARTKARIKACNYMMVMAVIGFIISINIGKRNAEAGDFVTTRITKWHDQINKESQEQKKTVEGS